MLKKFFKENIFKNKIKDENNKEISNKSNDLKKNKSFQFNNNSRNISIEVNVNKKNKKKNFLDLFKFNFNNNTQKKYIFYDGINPNHKIIQKKSLKNLKVKKNKIDKEKENIRFNLPEINNTTKFVIKNNNEDFINTSKNNMNPEINLISKIKSYIKENNLKKYVKSLIINIQKNPKFIKTQENILLNLDNNFKTDINYYEILEILGSGGCGKVYRARHIISNEYVAMKIIEKNRIKKGICIFKEIKILKILFGHNYINKIFEDFEDSQNYYIILELCSNIDLKGKVIKESSIKEDQLVKYVYQIWKGLDYIHINNIIHRDIKLDNIWIDFNDNCIITDFGISTIKNNNNEIIKDTPGTPLYIAPETLLAKGNVSYKTDLWSLGIVTFAAYFSEYPYFDEQNKQKIFNKIWKKNYSFPETMKISNNFKNLIKDLLTFEIDKRPALNKIMNYKIFTPKLKNEYSNPIINISNLNKKNSIIVKYILYKFGFNITNLNNQLLNKEFNHVTTTFYLLYLKLN